MCVDVECPAFISLSLLLSFIFAFSRSHSELLQKTLEFDSEIDSRLTDGMSLTGTDNLADLLCSLPPSLPPSLPSFLPLPSALSRYHLSLSSFVPPVGSASTFAIRHHCGEVVYDVYNLLNANADTVADDIIAAFNSKVGLVIIPL